MIWSTSFLNQLAVDAEQQINQDLNCIYFRTALDITAGTSVITLPAYVRSILRLTWRGKYLDPASWEDLQNLSPTTVFVSAGTKIETSQSRPQWYGMHPTNPYDIRFYPCPNESFVASATTDPYSPDNGAACILSCWRQTDDNLADPLLMLPKYIDRRTRKAYVLWKAYSAEGKGQDMAAAKYYQQKYEFLINQFRSINSGCFISKRYSLDDGMLSIDNFRYPKPMMPTQFERTLF